MAAIERGTASIGCKLRERRFLKIEANLRLARGDVVRIRSQRWHVLDVSIVRALSSSSRSGDWRGKRCPHPGSFFFHSRPSALLNPAALASLRLATSLETRLPDRISHHTPPGSLRAAGPARIDLMPHQLEPALAVIQVSEPRVLLADDVGLGKTIQAGLIISELETRGLAERVLILTPAGLRGSGRAKLSTRFGINATVVDFRDVRQRVANLPLGLNPWSTVRHVIASIDYAKRPEILKSVLMCRWDILAVDEAHGTATDSARHAAVEALASRVPYMLLLTATPITAMRPLFAHYAAPDSTATQSWSFAASARM